MASNGPKPARSGLSLYANLLDQSSSTSATPGTISRAPVVFNKTGGEQPQDETSAQKQQISAGRYASASIEVIQFVRFGLAHGCLAFALH